MIDTNPTRRQEAQGASSSLARRVGVDKTPGKEAAMNLYVGGSQQGKTFLEVKGDCFTTSRDGQLTILLRGLTRWGNLPAEELAEAVLGHYRRTGELPVEQLAGSFSIVLLDGERQRVLLHRNLMGNGFTYYRQTADGFLFASNLAELIERVAAPRVNAEVLPAYFLFRFVPGRQTLFQDCFRLQPGEQVIFEAGRIQRRQRQTFADLRDSPATDPVEQLEEIVGTILQDQAARFPATANLLSGGVDSTYLQAKWNQACGGPMRSFSVQVDHPCSRQDTEYALTAALALGGEHTLVAAADPYIDYLIDSLAATAEPPNHAFAVYFGGLARRMTAAGAAAGLCGEGADSLFGFGTADTVRHARWLRWLAPTRWLRRWGGQLADRLGRDCLADAFHLANHVHLPGHREHPLNQVAVFADWDLVEAAFGADRLDAALADRRALLDQCGVGDDPLERLHAAGYLGEAVDAASLWTTYFNQAGSDLCCPFLDSRLLSFSLSLPPRVRFPYRRPKGLLKQALARYVPPAIVHRFKLGFGQPVVEWLAAGGPLRGWAERIRQYDCIPAAVRSSALARPGWFLYSLLCFDLWHQLFIDRTLKPASVKSTSRSTAGRPASAGLGVALS